MQPGNADPGVVEGVFTARVWGLRVLVRWLEVRGVWPCPGLRHPVDRGGQPGSWVVPEVLEGWGRDPGPRGEEGGTGRGRGGTGAWGGREASRGRTGVRPCAWHYLGDLSECSDSLWCCDSELPCPRGISACFLPCGSATSVRARGLQVRGGRKNASHRPPTPCHSFQPVCLSPHPVPSFARVPCRLWSESGSPGPKFRWSHRGKWHVGVCPGGGGDEGSVERWGDEWKLLFSPHLA